MHDPEAFETFTSMSGPAIADFGGAILVRNPDPDHRKGDLRGLTIIIEFDPAAGAEPRRWRTEHTRRGSCERS